MADDRVAVHAPAVGRATVFLAFAAALALLTAIAWRYLPFMPDDALIALRYGARLAGGGGLTFNDGERVEGYSDLLWVLAVAAGSLVTRDAILAARAIGWIGAAAALAAVAWTAGRTGTRAAMLAALATLALSHSLAIWSIGGLEQGLLAGLLAWTLALITPSAAPARPGAHSALSREGDGLREVVFDDARDAAAPALASPGEPPRRAATTAAEPKSWRTGLLLALLTLTRPDGSLFTALVLLALLVTNGWSAATRRALLRTATLPALAWSAQLAFRLAYYGDWIPNTARVKFSPSPRHALEGLAYVGHALLAHAPFALLAVAGAVTIPAWRRRLDIVAPLAIAAGWLAYVAAIGGDIFPGYRHALPAIVALAFLVLAAWRDGLPGRVSPAMQGLLLVFICATGVWLQQHDPENARAATERAEWDCARLMSTLRGAFGDRDPLVAAETIGCVGYFGRFRTLDMLGLTDRHIAKTTPPGLGSGVLGHELGDGRYVLERRPDLLLFCGSLRTPPGCFRSARELALLPAFAREYVLTRVESDADAGNRTPLESLVWMRTVDGATGVTRDGDRRMRIPGWLFVSDVSDASGGETIAAHLAETPAGRRLVARLPPGAAARFDRLPPAWNGAPAATGTPTPWTAQAIASAPVAVTVDASGVRVTAGARASDLIEVRLSR